MQDTKQALLEATKGKKTYSLDWLTHALVHPRDQGTKSKM